MTRHQTALRGSAALIALALIAAPVAFQSSLFDSASALAQTQSKTNTGLTRTTIPDSTYGPGGTRESDSGADFRLTKEAVRDSTGRVRENIDFGANGTETSGFFDSGGRAVGVINVVPVNGGWQLSVTGFGPNVSDRTLELKTAATKEALENDTAFWKSQLRFWSTGNIGAVPTPPPGTPGFGLANPIAPPPGTAYAAGPGAAQTGGITLQCASDPACVSALAATSGSGTNLASVASATPGVAIIRCLGNDPCPDTLAATGGGAANLAGAVPTDTDTRTVNPDTTYGPGGDAVSYGRDGRVFSRLIRDDDGDPRESYTVAPNGGENWQFYSENGLSSPAGKITSLPIIAGGRDLWEVIVYGPDGTTVIGGHGFLTRADAEEQVRYWHGHLRSEAGGSARGLGVRFTDGPGAVQQAGPPQFRPQPGALTIQCFGDAACERAVAASRGQFDYGIRTPFDDGKGKRDEGKDGKDRPLYERPDLPRPDLPSNRLPYEFAPPPPP